MPRSIHGIVWDFMLISLCETSRSKCAVFAAKEAPSISQNSHPSIRVKTMHNGVCVLRPRPPAP